jgi:hypothetical protein
MSFVERPDGARIYYEQHGAVGAPPILLIAPGGLNSAVAFWERQPVDPIAAFSGEFRVIAMDQRNEDARVPAQAREGGRGVKKETKPAGKDPRAQEQICTICRQRSCWKA